MRPFHIHVADEVLDDLRTRLSQTRWPEAECVVDWSQGIPLGYTRELAAYWASGYDWRSREAALNRFAQFITEIDGLDIHFIHQRSPHQEAFPLLITHGWPGSIVEFHKVIEPLTNPTAHGDRSRTPSTWSVRRFPDTASPASPPRTGWGVDKIAQAWETLMLRLGYARYGAQGGDWGAAVTTQMGRHRGHCAAIHLNMPIAYPPAAGHRRFLRGRARGAGRVDEPPTLGHGLFRAAVHPATDRRVRAGRFASRTNGVDSREILGVDGLRRQPRERAPPR